MQPQVLALDVRRRQPRNPSAGFAAISPSLTASFRQTTSVPSVLLTVLARLPGLHGFGQLVHQAADVLDIHAAERRPSRARAEPHAAVALVRCQVPGSR